MRRFYLGAALVVLLVSLGTRAGAAPIICAAPLVCNQSGFSLNTVPVNKGGTNLTAAADDEVMVGNGTTWQSKALTNCTGSGKAVTYDTSTNSFGCNTITGTGRIAFCSILPVTVLSATPVFMDLNGGVTTTEARARTPFKTSTTFANFQCMPDTATTNAITAVIGENGCNTTADVTSKAQVVMSSSANTVGSSSGTTVVAADECAVVKMTAGTDAAETGVCCSADVS